MSLYAGVLVKSSFRCHYTLLALPDKVFGFSWSCGNFFDRCNYLVGNLVCEVVFIQFSDNMSWQDYVDKQLLASRCVTKAAIAGHDGNVWAKSDNFEVSTQ